MLKIVKDLFLINFYMKLENIFCNSSSILNSVRPVLWQRYPPSWKHALLRWEGFLLCCWVGRNPLHLLIWLAPMLHFLPNCSLGYGKGEMVGSKRYLTPALLRCAALAFGSAEDIAALQASGVFQGVLLACIACVDSRATFRTCTVAAQWHSRSLSS